ncbi:zeta toxin family protein [Streptomyces sp. NPDC048213]|uniref:zeta toxin family protein n=1 Tax=Streptomyces sp. NPDC048213 TaxID=3160984 RepID=UPI0033CC548E
MSTAEGQLPVAENARLFHTGIVPDFLAGCAPQRAPTIVIVSGQTGAGKSAVTRAVKEALDLNGPAAWINMDFYNPFHPEYARWQAERPHEADALVRPDGDLWWGQAQDYALSHGFNILLESAMVSPAEYEEICLRVRAAQLPPGVAPYRIETAFVAVAPPFSSQGITTRFLDELHAHGHGRLIDPAVHAASADGVLRGAAALEREGLGDYAVVMRRGAHVVHSQPISAGHHVPEDHLTLVGAIERERRRIQTPAEAGLFAARQAGAVLAAPEFLLAQLDDISRSAAPLLPEPVSSWSDAVSLAITLRSASSLPASDVTLLPRSTLEVTDFLAHALTDRHTALAQGDAPAATLHGQRVERLLSELARRSSLTPEQRMYEQEQRHSIQVAHARSVTHPGATLPARVSPLAARSRSTTVSRPPAGAPLPSPSPSRPTTGEAPVQQRPQRRGR